MLEHLLAISSVQPRGMLDARTVGRDTVAVSWVITSSSSRDTVGDACFPVRIDSS